jgi:hypothetical protein
MRGDETHVVIRFGLVMLAVLCLGVSPAYAQTQEREADEVPPRRHHVETFPIMAAVDVYSVQYTYAIHRRLEAIVGVAYVNVEVHDRSDVVIGRMHAPTLPVGLRWYVWRNAHVEYQLWPAYNAYRDGVEQRYYRGFDLYNEFRAGYRFDFSLGRVPLFSSLQYVYGFGLYPGNKPENFIQAVKDAPPFHVPSLSIGLRF